jgi:hypothetical protein
VAQTDRGVGDELAERLWLDLGYAAGAACRA